MYYQSDQLSNSCANFKSFACYFNSLDDSDNLLNGIHVIHLKLFFKTSVYDNWKKGNVCNT